MTAPRTEAGRTLVQRMLSSKTDDRMGPDDLQRAILAIEREAAQGAAPLDKYDSMADYEEHMAALGDPDLEGAAPACRHDAKWIEQFTDWVIRAHEQRKSDRAAPRAEGLEREAAGKGSPATPSLDRCDRIVNNGMGEPTECGRNLPCEYHDDETADEHLATHGCNVYHAGSPCRWQSARLDEGSATPDQKR